MQTKYKHVSKLPLPTFNWLHMNEALADWEEKEDIDYNLNPVTKAPAEALIGRTQNGEFPEGISGIDLKEDIEESSILKETVQFVNEFKNNRLEIRLPQGTKLQEPVLIDYNLDDENSYLVNQVCILAEENSEGTIVIRYYSHASKTAFHCGHVFIEAMAGSSINFIQMQMLDENSSHGDAVQALVYEGANLEVLLGDLGSSKVISGCDITLKGEEAKANLDSLYLGKGEEKKDFNYRITFAAKETEGYITAKACLTGACEKRFKSTIDFISGASGAKGREEESVLMLSDKVKNYSTPLLLCGEDNVEGEHATTSGKPDQDKLYYLMSRGFHEMDARKLLVEASLTPMINKLPFESLQEETLSYIREVIHHE